ncbi:polysaccharide deacetylase family protein [Anaerovorax odorimutans]|uniref:Polysaccharide deacetylase family protein n=1 Tax=Anaerovorax odorimutans TaxID=109327 RepID=A0ABT1RJB6_9FIRM|nr:polysaccharide deacetylase family protein [Anaerovorax odorimutans]MCQ4635270.1 polysaccharide deacetylase family protein [Anaerovorax odorimutans]
MKNKILSLLIIFTLALGFCTPFYSSGSRTYAQTRLEAPKDFQLQAKNKNSIQLKWKADKNAKGYVLYQYNKKKKKFKKIKTIKKKTTKSAVVKKIKQGKTEKFRMRAYTTINGKKKYSAYTYTVSGSTKSRKKNNVTAVKSNKKAYTLNKGDSLKLKVKILPKKKLVSKKINWTSSNNKIAKVSSSGKVKAVASGTAYVTARAHSGKAVKVKITVRSKYADEIPVLTFHRLVSEKVKKMYFADEQWVASIEDFRQQMKYLHDNGYKTLSMDEFYDWYSGNREYPKKTVVLTFDDGDYQLYYLGLPILKQYGFKGTAFIVGSRIKEATPAYEESNNRYFIGQDLIKRVKAEYPNLEFQSHSYDLHEYINNSITPIMYSKTLDELRDDFEQNKKFGFKYMAYPYGQYSRDYVTAFSESGYKLAFSFGKYRKARRTDPPYDIYRVKINGQISFEAFKKKVAVK